MTSVTYYVVPPFIRDVEGKLIAEENAEAPSAQSAVSRARPMGGRVAGAIAFSRTGDPALGEFAPAEILGRFGGLVSRSAG